MPCLERSRTVSMSSDVSEDFEITALDLADLRSAGPEYNNAPESLPSGEFFSKAFNLQKKKQKETTTKIRGQWKQLAKKALAQEDAWADRHIEEQRVRRARRYRYCGAGNWTVDWVDVKIEPVSFACGAMRDCYRLKKLSSFAKDDWKTAQNYVAKRYKNEDTPLADYFADVRLQMDAKRWGEAFNLKQPPKKVDIFQMYVLELFQGDPAETETFERRRKWRVTCRDGTYPSVSAGTTLYHCEHFLPGNYVKYNSNSGFRDMSRYTPHAFTHWTYEHSEHQLMVVDIQGVGDLYTDPQIHTATGDEYGEGNLGVRGMALFFLSHVCNPVCEKLGLTPFALSAIETQRLKKEERQAPTAALPHTEVRASPLPRHFRQRTVSHSSSLAPNTPHLSCSPPTLWEGVVRAPPSPPHMSNESLDLSVSPPRNGDRRDSYGSLPSSPVHLSPLTPPPSEGDWLARRGSCPSWTLDWVKHEARIFRSNSLQRIMSSEGGRSRHYSSTSSLASGCENPQEYGHLPAGAVVAAAEEVKAPEDRGVLGQVHLEVVRCYEIGRVEPRSIPCQLHHLAEAARWGDMEALVTLAQLHLDLPQPLFPQLEAPAGWAAAGVGVEALERAAVGGERWSTALLADARAGKGGLEGVTEDWGRAVQLYSTLLDSERGDHTCPAYTALPDRPPHTVLVAMADLLGRGGPNLKMDPARAAELYQEAGDEAMAAGQGRAATRYYMKAEEMWAEVPEEE